MLISGGRYFTVERRLPDGRIKFEENDTGEPVCFTDAEVAEIIASGTATYKRKGSALTELSHSPSSIVDFEDLPEKLKEEARRRFDYVDGVWRFADAGLTKQDIILRLNLIAKNRGDEKPPSIESYYRWRKRAGSPPRLSRLVERVHTKGNRSDRIDSKVRAIIDEKLSELVMRPEPEPINQVASAIRNAIDVYNETRALEDQLRKPGKMTIYDAFHALNSYDVLVAQKGKAFANRVYRAVGKGPEAEAPLSAVEIDHTQADIFVVDDNTGLPLGRPWVTALIDRYSKMVVGFYMGFTPPSYHSVGQALKHAIMPKGYVYEQYPEIENDWPCFGVPFELITDRGMEFIGHDLADACSEIGTNLFHSPTKQPWYKGSVERFFRTLNTRLLHQQKGTTFSNIIDRDEYDSEKNSVIAFKELLKLFHVWLIDDYSQNLHQGLRDIPVHKWRQGCNESPVPFIEGVEELRALVGKVEYRSLSVKGIRLQHLNYCSQEIVSWLTEGDFRRYAPNGKVKIKYDPEDLGMIWVQHPKTHKYQEVKALEFDYAHNLTEWQHAVITRHAREEVNERLNLPALDRAKEKIRRIVSAILGGKGRKPNKTSKSRAARFANIGGNNQCGLPSDNRGYEADAQALTKCQPVKSLPNVINGNNTNSDNESSLVTVFEELPSDEVDVYELLEEKRDGKV